MFTTSPEASVGTSPRRRARALVPPLSPAAPRAGNAVSRAVGRAVLRLLRWRLAGEVPNVPRLVVIAAPHTSTVDVFIALAALLALGVRVRLLAKHTIFRWPVRSILRWIGAVPIDRRVHGGFVGQAIALMQQSDACYLVIAPEGTRRKVREWKTGFYRIALGAGVPILPATLDYRHRISVLASPLMPTGDYEADVRELKTHFCAEMARHPERY